MASSSLCQRIREIRIGFGLSHERMAEKMTTLGVPTSRSTLIRTESQDRTADEADLRAIAAIAGVSVAYLLDGPSPGFIPHRIQQGRISMGLSRADLAKRMGKALNVLEAYEAEFSPAALPFSDAIRLASLFSCDPSVFLPKFHPQSEFFPPLGIPTPPIAFAAQYLSNLGVIPSEIKILIADKSAPEPIPVGALIVWDATLPDPLTPGAYVVVSDAGPVVRSLSQNAISQTPGLQILGLPIWIAHSFPPPPKETL